MAVERPQRWTLPGTTLSFARMGDRDLTEKTAKSQVRELDDSRVIQVLLHEEILWFMYLPILSWDQHKRTQMSYLIPLTDGSLPPASPRFVHGFVDILIFFVDIVFFHFIDSSRNMSLYFFIIQFFSFEPDLQNFIPHKVMDMTGADWIAAPSS